MNKLFGYIIDVKDDHFIVDPIIENYLKTHLKKERLNHSYSVAILSYEIAIKNYLENPLIYFLVGLLHDVGKYVDDKKAEDVMKEFFPNFLDIPKYAYHAFIATKMLKEDLNITDSYFLDAIFYHTTGKANLSDLAKVLFAADKIEPTRKYNSYPLIIKMFDDYNLGFIDVLKEDIKYLSNNDSLLNSNRLFEEMIFYYL